MSYSLFRFGDIVLPEYEKIQDLDTVTLANSTARTIAGSYRVAGSGRRPTDFPFAQTLECTVHDSTLATMRADIDNLRGLSGQYLRLYRRADDNSEIHWCYADVVQFRHRRQPQKYWWHDIKLDFEIWSPWYGIPHDGFWLNDEDYLNDGEYVNDETITETLTAPTYDFTVTNEGNLPVTSAVITVEAGAAALDDLQIGGYVSGVPNWAWIFSPTLDAGSTLVIDTQNYLVTVDGDNNYEGFNLALTHAVDTWFYLPLGDSTVSVSWTGGATDATITISYKDHWN